jgi:Fe-S-cluster containining protein
MNPEKWRHAKHKIAMRHSQDTDCRCDYHDILFWVRQGDCNQCGHCCQVIQPNHRFDLPGEIRDETEAEFLTTRGYTIDGKRAWIMTTLMAPCPELRVEETYCGPGDHWRQHSCAVWEHRPQTCQEFPLTPAQVRETPCSYWFEREDGRKVGGDDSPHPWRAADGVPHHGEGQAQPRHPLLAPGLNTDRMSPSVPTRSDE